MTLIAASERPSAPGRPAGEVRAVIVRKLREAGPMSQRDLALSAQIGTAAVRRTVDNMLRSEALVVAGVDKQPHSRRWVRLYDLAPEPAADDGSRHGHGWVDLARIVQGWAR